MKKFGLFVCVCLLTVIVIYFLNRPAPIALTSHIADNSILIDSRRIHFRDFGSGLPLIFVHGFGASVYSWRNNLGPISKNFRVFAIDLPGFGYSDKSLDADYSIDGYCNLIIQFMDYMQIRDAILVGHSLGGGIALTFALKYPERVRGLILIDAEAYAITPPFMLRIARFPVVGSLVHYVLGEWVIRISLKRSFYDHSLVTDDLVKEYYKPFLTENGKAAPIKVLQAMDFEKFKKLPAQYRKIQKKTLIIWGKEDQISNIHLAYKLQKDLPNSKLAIIPQSGHLVHEEQSSIVNRLIINFVKRKLNFPNQH